MNNVGSGAAEVIARAKAWLSAVEEPDPWVVETSGSTGVPKRVLLSRRAMLASAELSARRVGGSGAWVLALPPSYVAGLNVIVRSLAAGHDPVVLGDRDFGEVVDEVAPTGSAAFISLVPTQLTRLLETHPQGLQAFHTILLGGGPIDASLRARAAEAGVRVVATYGSAETCGGCVYDGVPLDGVGLAIGTDGRVRISGPVLAEGYADPELTAEVFVDGWFLTSDAGRLDADGRLQLLGRLDDMVITGGVNVPAVAVAARLRAHPRVGAAEVLGVPDEEWGNRLVAFVSLNPPSGSLSLASGASSPASGTSTPRVGTADPEFLTELRDWVAAERPRSWAPRQLVLLDRIPLLPNGKTDRLALRSLVDAPEGRLNVPEAGLNVPDRGRKVRDPGPDGAGG